MLSTEARLYPLWAVTIAGAGTWISSFPWRENSALKQIDAKLSWVNENILWQLELPGPS